MAHARRARPATPHHQTKKTPTRQLSHLPRLFIYLHRRRTLIQLPLPRSMDACTVGHSGNPESRPVCRTLVHLMRRGSIVMDRLCTRIRAPIACVPRRTYRTFWFPVCHWNCTNRADWMLGPCPSIRRSMQRTSISSRPLRPPPWPHHLILHNRASSRKRRVHPPAVSTKLKTRPRRLLLLKKTFCTTRPTMSNLSMRLLSRRSTRRRRSRFYKRLKRYTASSSDFWRISKRQNRWRPYLLEKRPPAHRLCLRLLEASCRRNTIGLALRSSLGATVSTWRDVHLDYPPIPKEPRKRPSYSAFVPHLAPAPHPPCRPCPPLISQHQLSIHMYNPQNSNPAPIFQFAEAIIVAFPCQPLSHLALRNLSVEDCLPSFNCTISSLVIAILLDIEILVRIFVVNVICGVWIIENGTRCLT